MKIMGEMKGKFDPFLFNAFLAGKFGQNFEKFSFKQTRAEGGKSDIARKPPNTFLRRSVLLIGQIHFALWTNTFCALDKYILSFGKMQVVLQANH